MFSYFDALHDTIFNLQYMDMVPPISAALMDDDAQEMKKLLMKGHSPQAPDNRGWTAIHYCVHLYNSEALKFILKFKKGSSKYLANLQTWEGESPLIMAVKKNIVDMSIVKILLKSGGDPCLRENDGKTPIHYACMNKGNLDVVKLLARYKADLNDKDSCNYTPLHYAIRKACDIDIVNYLVDLCDVNVKAQNLETPLHTACVMNFPEAVTSILEKDTSSVNAVTENKRTPLSVAVENSNLDIVRILLDAGADATREVRCGPADAVNRRRLLPIHFSFKSTRVFIELLRHTDAWALLEFEKKHEFISISILSVYHSKNDKIIEALLRHPFPPGCSYLNQVSVSKLCRFIIVSRSRKRKCMRRRFPIFFKYFSHLEPENVFEHLGNLMSDEEIVANYHPFRVLAKIGIPSTDSFHTKMNVIRALRNHNNFHDSQVTGRILETASMLEKPVPSLKQMSRVAFRRHVRHLSKNRDWKAFVMIKGMDLPRAIREYIWYQTYD